MEQPAGYQVVELMGHPVQFLSSDGLKENQHKLFYAPF
jgi:hypothetical protein